MPGNEIVRAKPRTPSAIFGIMRGMETTVKRPDGVKLPLPVGKSDWEYVAARNYCVDKTLLIRDLLASDAGVALFTRPRRFGKTTAMKMLKCFFEKRGEGEPDVRHLFECRAIAHCENADEWMSHQGKYPVIYLTFKDHKARNWEEALEQFKMDVGSELRRHVECVKSLPSDKDREHFNDICEERCSTAQLGGALGLLAKALHLHHGVKPIVLIDEYDSPVNSASTYGYYDEMVALMRTFLPGAMKDNDHVEMGVMTGVLRVAKEGILSGLNNLTVYTVFDRKFSEHFGFTEAEVEEMARYYGREDKMPEIKAWYDGYDFGGREIYNPWSVLYYFDNDCIPQPYWLDTSSNDLINELVETLPFDMAETLESLLHGKARRVPMTRELGPYQFIRDTPQTLYALLVSTGYLKPVGGIESERCLVKIPNHELEHVFTRDILYRLRKLSRSSEAENGLEDALLDRDVDAFREHVERFLVESASYFDASAEGFYHGLVLGMLSFMRRVYVIMSNRESGYGRFDIMLKPLHDYREFPAVVIEVKAAKGDEDDLDTLAAEARRQIDEKNYAASLEAEGITDIMKFGYAFHGKRSAICK